jgi:hypothetical protein
MRRLPVCGLSLLNERRAEAPKAFIAFGDPVYERNAESVVGPALRAGGAARVNLQPLPYSREEITGIAKLFADDDRAVFFAEDASEENVKALAKTECLSNSSLFNTWLTLTKQDRIFSGLLLSSPRTSGQPEDGSALRLRDFQLETAS